jgi:hypothetical protein
MISNKFKKEERGYYGQYDFDRHGLDCYSRLCMAVGSIGTALGEMQ